MFPKKDLRPRLESTLDGWSEKAWKEFVDDGYEEGYSNRLKRGEDANTCFRQAHEELSGIIKRLGTEDDGEPQTVAQNSQSENNERQFFRPIHNEKLPANESLRWHVFNHLLADKTMARKDYQDFRQQVVGSEHLSSRQWQYFRDSPAVRVFSAKQLRTWGIPLSQVRSEVHYSDRADGRVDLTITFMEVDMKQTLIYNRADAVIDKRWHDEGNRVASADSYLYPLRGSILAELQDFAQNLSQQLNWNNWSTLEFILRGYVPVGAIYQPHTCFVQTAETNNQWKPYAVEVALQPWLSDKTVIDIFRTIQKASGKTRSRPILLKNLMFLYFIYRQKPKQQTVADLTETQRRILWEEWNTKCSEADIEPKIGEGDRWPDDVFRDDYYHPDWVIKNFKYVKQLLQSVEKQLLP